MSWESWAKNLGNNLIERADLLIDKKVVHSGKLQSPYFEYVGDGVKKYEMRVNDEKR